MGVPADPLLVSDYVSRSACGFANRIALAGPGRKLAYRVINSLSVAARARLHQFGQTEMTCTLDPEYAASKIGSVGTPLAHVQGEPSPGGPARPSTGPDRVPRRTG